MNEWKPPLPPGLTLGVITKDIYEKQYSSPPAIGGEVFKWRYLETRPSLLAGWAGALGTSEPGFYALIEKQQLFHGETGLGSLFHMCSSIGSKQGCLLELCVQVWTCMCTHAQWLKCEDIGGRTGTVSVQRHPQECGCLRVQTVLLANTWMCTSKEAILSRMVSHSTLEIAGGPTSNI